MKPQRPNDKTAAVSQRPASNGFVRYLRSQKQALAVFAGIALTCYILLRIFFPLPDFFTDSHSYIEWAVRHLDVTYRPIGYHAFLEWVHTYSNSAIPVTAIQYILYCTSTAFCYFSIDYLYGFSKKLKWILLVLCIFNPILLFQTNCISSDSIFTSLSVFWFSFLLWSIRKQSLIAVTLQIVFLYLAFQVRYNALFYPIVAVAAFAVSPTKTLYKIGSVTALVAVIIISVRNIQDTTEKRYGVRIFSGFSGWQIANNALYIYKHIDVDINDLPSVETQTIERYVRYCLDSADKEQVKEIGSYYMWSKRSPLKQYCFYINKQTHDLFFTTWLNVAPHFSDYGWYIIKHNPLVFTRYFILPNTMNYFWPSRESLVSYDPENAVLPPDTKTWFNLKSDRLYCRFPGLQKNIMVLYPFFSLVLNLFSLFVIFFSFYQLIFKRKKLPRNILVLLLCWSAFFLINMAFSIFASVMVLRYLNLLFIVGLLIPVILWENLRAKAE